MSRKQEKKTTVVETVNRRENEEKEYEKKNKIEMRTPSLTPTEYSLSFYFGQKRASEIDLERLPHTLKMVWGKKREGGRGRLGEARKREKVSKKTLPKQTKLFFSVFFWLFFLLEFLCFFLFFWRSLNARKHNSAFQYPTLSFSCLPPSLSSSPPVLNCCTFSRCVSKVSKVTFNWLGLHGVLQFKDTPGEMNAFPSLA